MLSSGVTSTSTNLEKGTSAEMSTILAFVKNNWDSSVWNLSLDNNPTLK
ncbi:MAG: hypothetical protein IJX17_06670 [Clostridia bacterium]|nr:hypothetical protein [Clostridia bacterium]